MVANRSRDTKPELRVRSAVHRRGLRYRVAARPIQDLPRTADMVFRPAKVAVFIDGCFWHGCPEHYTQPRTNADYWSAKIARNKGRDSETDQRLRDAGWTVLRYWEHEPVQEVVEDIVTTVNASRNG
ncbi:MAG: very short patch repair endonuclease [Acidimicrobiia bacterium]|nr:very short patch repair endonuclease [Acidimicrobiia bacterium]MYB23854.1 very short patch repair endonuclease [Acidimicrobiia bacterium]MYE67297.1 very short patch repair endonuclease [Acidimicrobiia bacterium]MYJ13785.1 very short patch repair endonuclease [Acidimicrobiia bacterium]